MSFPSRPDIAAGDTLVAIASSGVHSNGYSLVRKIVELSGLAWTAEAPFAPGTPLSEALLTPTRIYVKSLLSALKSGFGITSGICTDCQERFLMPNATLTFSAKGEISKW